MEYGVVNGERCNRDGCSGIIDEHPKEGGCSCHINPPCSYCTTDTAYCPICDWHAGDDLQEVDPEVEKRNREYYEIENKRYSELREKFYSVFNGKEPVTEPMNWSETHTHFTMKKLGVFIPGTETMLSIESKVKGTFGGRFEYFNGKRGVYSYITYTD